MTRPAKKDGQHAPTLCFGDLRVMAMLATILAFIHVLAGFRNRQCTIWWAAWSGPTYSWRQATYDLRGRA